MYHRLANLSNKHSFFLFGARATGKSSLIASLILPDKSIWIDFLDDQQFIAFSKNPKLLEERINTYLSLHGIHPEWIVLDEIQRVPKVLNEVHRLMESKDYSDKITFAITGSSARKLKRRGANMLGGRAIVKRLYPFTHVELGKDFNLERVLNWGSLPKVYTANDDALRAELLRSYVTTYISEEIREEQVVRQIDPFLRFLEVVGQSNAEIINNALIGRDCQVEPKTVARYFQILEDTLLGFFLPAYDRSVRKQQRKTAKFYFFDLGVVKALCGTLTVPIIPNTYGYGKVFEAFVVNEIYRLNQYYTRDYKLSYLRTKDDAEIDLVIHRPQGDTVIIEIKSSKNVSAEQANKLERFLPSIPKSRAMILSQEDSYRRLGKVDIFPWREGIQKIFDV